MIENDINETLNSPVRNIESSIKLNAKNIDSPKFKTSNESENYSVHESQDVANGILSTVICTPSDEDISTHSKILKSFMDQLYNSSQAHIISVKQRLLEEKDIALIEAERVYLNKYDQYQNEISGLHKEIRNLESRKIHADNSHIKLCSKVINVLDKHHYKHSSSYSVSKIFRLWYEEVQSTRNFNKMDKVAISFARKKLLTKIFYQMAYNFQKRKAIKQQSESQFKFDSVTTEIILSYESQLQRMRDDLKDAYASIEQEQIRRQQLEENLRTLFLKNMTNMNFEALSLFQNSHSMVDGTITGVSNNTTGKDQKKNSKNQISEGSSIEKSKALSEKSSYQYDNLIETPSSHYNLTPNIKSPPIIPMHPKDYELATTIVNENDTLINPYSSNNNLLSELYKSNMSSTMRLAHNTTPLTQSSVGRSSNVTTNSSRPKNK